MTPELSVIIPAYNEEGCIEPTLRQLSAVLEREAIDYEVVVVNDNSSDATAEILDRLSGENPRLKRRDNSPPNGFGLAVRCGIVRPRSLGGRDDGGRLGRPGRPSALLPESSGI
jgi:glycosyltransferase involved in cell wall biosynthesis